MTTLYTIGYEGRGHARPITAGDRSAPDYPGSGIANFLSLLEAHQIYRLVDVRDAARSRNPHFAKNALACWLRSAGIEYQHLPEFGIPADRRTGDRATVLDNYEADLLFSASSPLFLHPDIEEIIDDHTAIMCVEFWPDECHRGRLARVLSRRTGCAIAHILDKPSALAYEGVVS